jgi:hypothetical protein
MDCHGNRKGEDSVLESSTLWVLRDVQGFKEVKMYLNSEFDLCRVLPRGCFYF